MRRVWLYRLSGRGREKIGVVLMHGKGRTAKAQSPVGKLATTLEAAGFLVTAPDMPWSRSRGFDKSHKDSMAEIDEAVEDLKSDGATRVVVGGHSIGANAALAYGARRDGLAGVLAIAPGHIIENEGFQDKMDFDYRRARAMVAAGKGAEENEFKDYNQGQSSTPGNNRRILPELVRPRRPGGHADKRREPKTRNPVDVDYR